MGFDLYNNQKKIKLLKRLTLWLDIATEALLAYTTIHIYFNYGGMFSSIINFLLIMIPFVYLAALVSKWLDSDNLEKI